MEKKKTTILVTLMFLAYIGAIFFCCLHNFSGSDVDLSKSFLGIRMDRVAHFTMFFPYPFICWLLLTYNKRIKVYHNYILAAIIASGVVVAFLAEGSQGWLTSYRESDYVDFIANVTGILSGTLILYIIRPLLISFLGIKK